MTIVIQSRFGSLPTHSTVSGKIFPLPSSAWATMLDGPSPGARSRLADSNISRVRGPAKLYGLFSLNGSRVNNTESRARARFEVSSVNSTGTFDGVVR